ncbi:MAG: thioesterase [Cyclobacteriaceae bacterium]|nr:thioesterase [Cyclobacteriaceae bacterium]
MEKKTPVTHYQKALIVGPEVIDRLGHVNNVAYLQWVQEIAGEHWYHCVPQAVDELVYWVVLHHSISYRKPCFVHDHLTIKTAIADDESGPKWGRHVWIYREDHLAVEAFTTWCLMDRKTNRPRRISGEITDVFRPR